MKGPETLLSLFAGAAKARDLYPEGHPARRQAINNLLQGLKPHFINHSEAAFGVVEDTLVFEDRPVYEPTPALDELLQLLQEIEVKAVHIKREAAIPDIEILLATITSPAAVQEKGGWISRQVESRTQSRIIVLPEVPDAHKVYSDAIDYMGNLFGELRMGQIPKPEGAVNVAKDVSDCVLRNEQAILGLTMIKSFDNYLFNHSVNVCVLSMALAKAAGITEPTMTEVGLGGLLHDVGKIRVPKEILTKPGKLTASEWDVMKAHSTFSFEIIGEMGHLEQVTARCALEHHVQYDHQGYPNLGSGKKAQPFSHLVAIADCYDAITTLRTYQKPMAPYDALKIMDRLVGTKLDPEYFKAFVAMLGIYPPGSVVRLDSNEIAVVIENHPDAPNEPLVRVIFDKTGRPLAEPFDVNLSAQSGPRRDVVATIDPVMKNIQVDKYLSVEKPPS